jgi:Glycosyl-hydrolase family 116, catalytic region
MMMQEGLVNEGLKTAKGIVDTTYYDIGYQFQVSLVCADVNPVKGQQRREQRAESGEKRVRKGEEEREKTCEKSVLIMITQTPEAWDSEKHYRAIGYMRRLAIWGMQYVWENGVSGKKVSVCSSLEVLGVLGVLWSVGSFIVLSFYRFIVLLSFVILFAICIVFLLLNFF